MPCAWASSSAGQVSLSKHWVNALADPKPTQGDSQLLHAGFARDEWGRTSPSPPTAVSPHQQHPSAWGQPPSSFFFFFPPYFFSITLKYWASSCVDVDLSPSFICILEQMLEVLVERHAAKGFMMVGHRAVQLGEFRQTLAGGPPVPAPQGQPDFMGSEGRPACRDTQTQTIHLRFTLLPGSFLFLVNPNLFHSKPIAHLSVPQHIHQSPLEGHSCGHIFFRQLLIFLI